jgi:hypothetical protein
MRVCVRADKRQVGGGEGRRDEPVMAYLGQVVYGELGDVKRTANACLNG